MILYSHQKKVYIEWPSPGVFRESNAHVLVGWPRKTATIADRQIGLSHAPSIDVETEGLLELGIVTAGRYVTVDQAVHWDGKTESNEMISSDT